MGAACQSSPVRLRNVGTEALLRVKKTSARRVFDGSAMRWQHAATRPALRVALRLAGPLGPLPRHPRLALELAGELDIGSAP